MDRRRPVALVAMSVMAVACAVAVVVWALARPGSPTSAPGETPAASATPTSTTPTSTGGGTATASGSSAGSSTSASASGPLRVVGLGDSVEAGTACSGCTAFVGLVGQRIGAEQHRTPQVDTIAANGWTTTDVLAQLSTDTVRQAITASDLVVVEIGANDLDETQAASSSCASDPTATCYAADLATVKRNLTTIVTTVKSLQQRPGAQVVLLGYWNVFADGQVALQQGSTYVSTSTTVTSQFNANAEQVARSCGALWADAATPFKGTDNDADDTRYLAADGEHPNQAGHQLLAQAVLDALGARAATV